jgi:hypothetical protein
MQIHLPITFHLHAIIVHTECIIWVAETEGDWLHCFFDVYADSGPSRLPQHCAHPVCAHEARHQRYQAAHQLLT